METILEINNLCKSYGDFHLNNLNMLIEKGTLIGFIGPNGSGKTTTIKSILNMIKPDQGKITILGLDNITHDLEIKSKLGVVLDDGHFYEDLSLQKMKNLIAPMYSTWDNNIYHSYMEKFALPEQKKIKELSRGMRMKYALVLALSHNAELFILDEPTSGLDPIYATGLLMLSYLIMRNFAFNDAKYKTKLLFGLLPVTTKTIIGARIAIVYLFCLIATPLVVLFSNIIHKVKPDMFAAVSIHILPFGLLLFAVFLPIAFLIFHLFEPQKADIIAALASFPYMGLMFVFYKYLRNSPLWIIVFIIAIFTNVVGYIASQHLYKQEK